MYQQAQKENRRPTELVRGKDKAYNFTVDQAATSREVVTGIIVVHMFLHMSYLILALHTALFIKVH